MTVYRMATRKALGIVIVLLYMNSLFIIFAPEVFASIMTLTPILLLSVVVSMGIAIRPISTKSDQSNRALMAISFLFLPLIVALPHLEFIYLGSAYLLGVKHVMSLVGVIILLLASMALLASRVQIGQFGGPRITIEDDHQLVTTGMYRYIRNPQYLGFLLLLFGYAFSLGSILVALLTVIGLSAVFRSRIKLEEELLLTAFGDEYRDYMERTCRLIPRVY